MYFLLGKVMKEQRWSATYLRGYKYFDVYHEANLDVPDVLKPLIEWVKEKWPKMNQCLVNWYTSSDHIGAHSDDEQGIIQGEPILSFSYGGTRTFRINAKKTDQKVQKLDVFVRNNTAIEVRDNMQKTHKHEILKIPKGDQNIPNNRINITFRAFQ